MSVYSGNEKCNIRNSKESSQISMLAIHVIGMMVKNGNSNSLIVSTDLTFIYS